MTYVSPDEYPFVLICRTCGTHYAYLKKKPSEGDIVTDQMIYATGEAPAGPRAKTCFHCNAYVVFNLSQIQYRGVPLTSREKTNGTATDT